MAGTSRGQPRPPSRLLLAVFVATLLAGHVAGGVNACDNDCSNNGFCIDGKCLCDPGYSGEDCSVTTQLTAIGRQLDSAAVSDSDAGAAGHGLLSASNEGQESQPAARSLQNVLAYAESLFSQGLTVSDHLSRGRKLLAASGGGPEEHEALGCGFYDDVFYADGQGCSPGCFYDVGDCNFQAPDFYGFYGGMYGDAVGDIPLHAPEVQFTQSFSGLETSWADRPQGTAEWYPPQSAVSGMQPENKWRATRSPAGDRYMGKIEVGSALYLSLDQLPSTKHNVSISVDYLVDSYVKEDAIRALGVVGMGYFEPKTLKKGLVHANGVVVYEAVYELEHSAEKIRFKFSVTGPNGNATWGIDNLVVTTTVANYAPVARSEDVQVPKNSQNGVTVHLVATDEECEEVDYYITSLPTWGTLYLCACDALWTQGLTEDMLPYKVSPTSEDCSGRPSPAKVVYLPQPNVASDVTVDGRIFDKFTYAAADAGGRWSKPATITAILGADAIAPDTRPVAGDEGFAAAFNGRQFLSMSDTTGTRIVDYSEVTLECRFKVTGQVDYTVLIGRPGSFRLGFYPGAGLSLTAHAVNGDFVASSKKAYNDGQWHHAVGVHARDLLSLYVDGELVANLTGVFGRPGDALNNGVIFVGGVPEVNVFANSQLQGFDGYLDEVRLWKAALPPSAVKALYLHNNASTLAQLRANTSVACLPELPAHNCSQEVLMFHLDFQEGPASSPVVYDRTEQRHDGHLGHLAADGFSDGRTEFYPTFVASTDSFGNAYTTVEDKPVSVPLKGGDLDGGVTFVITTMPSHGGLRYKDKDGEWVVLPSKGRGPYPISAKEVEYMPDPSYNGRDIFKYVSTNGRAHSRRVGVKIVVLPKPTAPQISANQTMAISADDVAAGYAVLALSVGNPDGGDANAIIATLPAHAWLHQYGSAHAPVGPAITKPGTQLTDPHCRVVVTGLQDRYKAVFSWYASNGAARSIEGSVQLDFPDDEYPQMAVAGPAGYALRFEHGGQLLLPSLPAALLKPDHNTSTLAFQLKLGISAATSHSFRILQLSARADPYANATEALALEHAPHSGLHLSYAGKKLLVMGVLLHDQAWHAVLLSWNATTTCFQFDDAQPLCHAWSPVHTAAVYDAELLFGGGHKPGGFQGTVDNIALWRLSGPASEFYRPGAEFLGVNQVKQHDVVCAAGAFVDVEVPSYVKYPPHALYLLNEGYGTCAASAAQALATGCDPENLGVGGKQGSLPKWVVSTAPSEHTAVVVEDAPHTLLMLSISSRGDDEFEPYLVSVQCGAVQLRSAVNGMPLPLPAPGDPTKVPGGKLYFHVLPGYQGDSCSLQYIAGKFDKLRAQGLVPVNAGADVPLMWQDPISTDVQVAPVSNRATLKIKVINSNHPPSVCRGGCRQWSALGRAMEEVPVSIYATDVDKDDLTFYVANLPAYGYLMDTDSSTISSAGAVIPSSGGRAMLTYVVLANTWNIRNDTFGFQVSDGCAKTEPVEVQIDFSDLAAQGVPDIEHVVAGPSGAALCFDGKDDSAWLANLTLGNETTTSFSLWFRSHFSQGPAALLTLGDVAALKADSNAVTLVVGKRTIHAVGGWNDGLWHHLSFDLILNATGLHPALLLLDGHRFYPPAPSHPFYHPGPDAQQGGSDMYLHVKLGGAKAGFRGCIDDVAIFSTDVDDDSLTAKPLSHAAVALRMPLSHAYAGRLPGCIAYLMLNEGEGTALDNACRSSMPGELSMGGRADMTPVRKPSVIFPMARKLKSEKAASVVVPLEGVAIGEEEPVFAVSLLPESGTMKTAAGAAVVKDAPLLAGTRELVYTPDEFYEGRVTLAYVVVGPPAVVSQPYTVAIRVYKRNHRPVCNRVSKSEMVDFTDPAGIRFHMSCHDLDGDDLSWIVTKLPKHGTLYAGRTVISPSQPVMYTDPVTTSGALLSSRYLWFVPELNADVAWDAMEYTVTDGMETLTSVQTVNFSALGTVAVKTPVIGNAGLAVEFDGSMRNVVTLRPLHDYTYRLGTRMVSSFGVSLWFKTTCTAMDGLVLVKSPLLALVWSRVEGLTVVGYGGTTSSSTAYNDGAWHQVNATITLGKHPEIQLAVDGYTFNATKVAMPQANMNASVLIGSDGAAGKADRSFIGQVDEVRILVDGTTVGYYQFNEAEGGDVYNAVTGTTEDGDAETLGRGGRYAPERVTSTAPVSKVVVYCLEDEEVVIRLPGYIDVDTTPVFTITTLPAKGQLYSLDGSLRKRITKATDNQLPGTKVVFRPEPNEHSSGGIYSRFVYKAEHPAVGGISSQLLEVTVIVVPVNDAPVVVAPDSIDIPANAVEKIPLKHLVLDTEGDAVFIITDLPDRGALALEDGTDIDSTPYTLPMDTAALLFRPDINTHGMPYTSFAFQVFDDETMLPETEVTINVHGGSGFDLGMSGFLLLKNLDKHGAALAKQLGSTPMYTLDFWAKFSDLASAVSRVHKLIYGTTAIVHAKDKAPLILPINMRLTPAYKAVDKEMWHHVTLVHSPYHGAGKALYVDGHVVAAGTLLEAGAELKEADVLRVHCGVDNSNCPQGLVLKEVRVWSKEIDGPGIKELAHTQVTGKESELLAWWSLSAVSQHRTTYESMSGASAAVMGGRIVNLAVPVPSFMTKDLLSRTPLVKNYGNTGAAGYALDFDGVDDVIAFPVDRSPMFQLPSSFTLEAWFKTFGPIEQPTVLLDLDGIMLGWDKVNGLGAYSAASGKGVYSSSRYNDGLWHYLSLVVAYAGDASFQAQTAYPGYYNLQIYIDGELAAEGPAPIPAGHMAASQGSPSVFLIGGAKDPAMNKYHTLLDELRMYAGARSHTDMGDRYYRPDFSAPETLPSTLLAYFTFDEGHGNEAGNSIARITPVAPAGATVYGAEPGDGLWVPSTAPLDIPMLRTYVQDPLALELGTESGVGHVRILLHSLPKGATLYNSDEPAVALKLSDTADATQVPSDKLLMVASEPGMTSFSYSLTDGMEEMGPYQIAIDILAKGIAPSFTAASYNHTICSNDYAMVDVSALVQDADSPEVDVYVVAPPQGKLYSVRHEGEEVVKELLHPLQADAICKDVLAKPCMLAYEPPINAIGSDMFSLKASDGELQSAAADVVVTTTATLHGIACPRMNLPVCGAPGRSLSLGMGAFYTRQVDPRADGAWTVDFWMKSAMVAASPPTAPHFLFLGNDLAETNSSHPTFCKISLAFSQASTSFRVVHDQNLALQGETLDRQTVEAPRAALLDNDWHHVAIVHRNNRTSLHLYVDGAPAAVAYTMKAWCSVTNLVFQRFEGQVDELRVWGKALTKDELQRYSRVRMPDDALLFSETFDDPWVADSSGLNTGSLSYDGSSAPVPHGSVEVTENSALPLDLSSKLFGVSSLQNVSDGVVVTELPARGSLMVQNQTVRHVPFRVRAGAAVEFKPEPYTAGNPYGSLCYACEDATSGILSKPSCISIVVRSVGPRPPSVEAPAVSACAKTGGMVPVQVLVSSSELTAGTASSFSAHITPPAGARMHQMNSDGTPGWRLPHGQRSMLTYRQPYGGEGQLVFMAMLDAASSPPGELAFEAAADITGDFVGALLNTTAATAILMDCTPGPNVTAPPPKPDAPVNTVQSYALHLYSGDTFSVRASRSADLPRDMTVQMWVVTDAPDVRGMRLLSSPGMTVYVPTGNASIYDSLARSVVLKLSSKNLIAGTSQQAELHMEVVCEEAKCLVNDNKWHHVSASYISSTKTAYLFWDGELAGQASAETTPGWSVLSGTDSSASVTVSVGAPPAGGQVSVDEIKLWGKALTPEQRDRMALTALSERPASPAGQLGLMAYFPFVDPSNTTFRNMAFDGLTTVSASVSGSGAKKVLSKVPVSTLLWPVPRFAEMEPIYELPAATSVTNAQLRYAITSLPAKGMLYDSEGKPITSAPYGLKDRQVLYSSDAKKSGIYGKGVAKFSYAAYILVEGRPVYSKNGDVTIDLVYESAPPTLQLPSTDLQVQPGEYVVVEVTADDLDVSVGAEELTFMVTGARTAVGQLFTLDSNGMLGDPISVGASPTLIPKAGPKHAMIAYAAAPYIQGLADSGPLQETVSLSVTDGASAVPGAQTVTINVYHSNTTLPVPAVGPAGNALLLGTGSTLVVTGDAAQVQQQYTASAWFFFGSGTPGTIIDFELGNHFTVRTSLTAGRVLELVYTPLASVARKLQGVQIAVNPERTVDRNVTSDVVLDQGAWFHITLLVDLVSSTFEVRVDGASAAATTVVGAAPSPLPQEAVRIAFGNSVALDQPLAGQVDDVVVLGGLVDAWDAKMAVLPSGSIPTQAIALGFDTMVPLLAGLIQGTHFTAEFSPVGSDPVLVTSAAPKLMPNATTDQADAVNIELRAVYDAKLILVIETLPQLGALHVADGQEMVPVDKAPFRMPPGVRSVVYMPGTKPLYNASKDDSVSVSDAFSYSALLQVNATATVPGNSRVQHVLIQPNRVVYNAVPEAQDSETEYEGFVDALIDLETLASDLEGDQLNYYITAGPAAGTLYTAMRTASGRFTRGEAVFMAPGTAYALPTPQLLFSAVGVDGRVDAYLDQGGEVSSAAVSVGWQVCDGLDSQTEECMPDRTAAATVALSGAALASNTRPPLAGDSGWAAVFYGGSQMAANVGSVDFSKGFVLQMWLKRGMEGLAGMTQQGTATLAQCSAFHLQMAADGTLTLSVGSDSSLVISTDAPAVPLHEWAWIEVSYSTVSYTARILVDNQEKASAAMVSLPLPSSGGPFRAMVQAVGLVSEVRLWNLPAATSAKMVDTVLGSDYLGGPDDDQVLSISGYEEGLAAYWRFHEGSGASVYDWSLHGNTAALEALPGQGQSVDWVPSGAPASNAIVVMERSFNVNDPPDEHVLGLKAAGLSYPVVLTLPKHGTLKAVTYDAGSFNVGDAITAVPALPANPFGLFVYVPDMPIGKQCVKCWTRDAFTYIALDQNGARSQPVSQQVYHFPVYQAPVVAALSLGSPPIVSTSGALNVPMNQHASFHVDAISFHGKLKEVTYQTFPVHGSLYTVQDDPLCPGSERAVPVTAQHPRQGKRSVYRPPINGHGDALDSFEVRAFDGNTLSDPFMVTVNVIPDHVLLVSNAAQLTNCSIRDDIRNVCGPGAAISCMDPAAWTAMAWAKVGQDATSWRHYAVLSSGEVFVDGLAVQGAAGAAVPALLRSLLGGGDSVPPFALEMDDVMVFAGHLDADDVMHYAQGVSVDYEAYEAGQPGGHPDGLVYWNAFIGTNSSGCGMLEVLDRPVAGPMGYALDLSHGARVVIPAHPAYQWNSSFSLEAVIRAGVDDFAANPLALANQVLMEKTGMFRLFFNQFGQLTWEVINTAQEAVTATMETALSDSALHYVVATFDLLGGAHLYVDGDLEGSATGSTFTPDAVNGVITAGPFTGALAQISLYNVARKSEDITRKWYSNFAYFSGDPDYSTQVIYDFSYASIKEPGIVGLYTFNEGEGSVARTLVGDAHASIEGPPLSAVRVPTPIPRSMRALRTDIASSLCIELFGSVQNTSTLEFMITTVPPAGALYLSDNQCSTKLRLLRAGDSVPVDITSASGVVFLLYEAPESLDLLPDGLLVQPLHPEAGANSTNTTSGCNTDGMKLCYTVFDGSQTSNQDCINIIVTPEYQQPAAGDVTVILRPPDVGNGNGSSSAPIAGDIVVVYDPTDVVIRVELPASDPDGDVQYARVCLPDDYQNSGVAVLPSYVSGAAGTNVIVGGQGYGMANSRCPYTVLPNDDGALAVHFTVTKGLTCRTGNVDRFRYNLVDAMGLESNEASVYIKHEVPRNESVVITASPQMHTYGAKDILSPIRIIDPNYYPSANGLQLEVELKVTSGMLSLALHPGDVWEGVPPQIAARESQYWKLTGSLLEVNQQLGHVYYQWEDPDSMQQAQLQLRARSQASEWTEATITINNMRAMQLASASHATLSAVRFSNDGMYLMVDLASGSGVIEYAFFQGEGMTYDCSKLLTDVALGAVGCAAGAACNRCTFETRSASDWRFKVQLSPNATVRPGQKLPLFNTAVLFANRMDVSKILPDLVPVANALKPLAPTAAFAITQSSKCTGIRGESLFSYGDAGRQLEYLWGLEGEHASCSLLAMVAATKTGTLEVLSPFVQDLSSITVHLAVCNWMGQCSTQFDRNSTVYNGAIPVSYLVPMGAVVRGDLPLPIRARTVYPQIPVDAPASCKALDVYNLRMALRITNRTENGTGMNPVAAWTETVESLKLTKEQKELSVETVVPVGALSFFEDPYDVGLVTYIVQDNDEDFPLHDSAVLHIFAKPLVSLIMGGSRAVWRNTVDFPLDGCRSYDPMGEALSFQWSCTTSSGSVCGATFAPDCAQTLAAGSLAIGTYNITLNITDTRQSRWAASTLQLEMTNRMIPLLLIDYRGNDPTNHNIRTSLRLFVNDTFNDVGYSFGWGANPAAGVPDIDLSNTDYVVMPRPTPPNGSVTLTNNLPSSSSSLLLLPYTASSALVHQPAGRYSYCLRAVSAVDASAATGCQDIAMSLLPTAGSIVPMSNYISPSGSPETWKGIEVDTQWTWMFKDLSAEREPLVYAFGFLERDGETFVPLTTLQPYAAVEDKPMTANLHSLMVRGYDTADVWNSVSLPDNTSAFDVLGLVEAVLRDDGSVDWPAVTVILERRVNEMEALPDASPDRAFLATVLAYTFAHLTLPDSAALTDLRDRVFAAVAALPGAAGSGGNAAAAYLGAVRKAKAILSTLQSGAPLTREELLRLLDLTLEEVDAAAAAHAMSADLRSVYTTIGGLIRARLDALQAAPTRRRLLTAPEEELEDKLQLVILQPIAGYMADYSLPGAGPTCFADDMQVVCVSLEELSKVAASGIQVGAFTIAPGATFTAAKSQAYFVSYSQRSGSSPYNTLPTAPPTVETGVEVLKVYGIGQMLFCSTPSAPPGDGDNRFDAGADSGAAATLANMASMGIVSPGGSVDFRLTDAGHRIVEEQPAILDEFVTVVLRLSATAGEAGSTSYAWTFASYDAAISADNLTVATHFNPEADARNAPLTNGIFAVDLDEFVRHNETGPPTTPPPTDIPTATPPPTPTIGPGDRGDKDDSDLSLGLGLGLGIGIPLVVALLAGGAWYAHQKRKKALMDNMITQAERDEPLEHHALMGADGQIIANPVAGQMRTLAELEAA